MTDEKHNGWSNYATWRIKLEIFDDDRYEEEVTAEQLKEECDEIISGFGEIKEPSLALDYTRAFVSDVDWYEIAESINQNIKENKSE